MSEIWITSLQLSALTLEMQSVKWLDGWIYLHMLPRALSPHLERPPTPYSSLLLGNLFPFGCFLNLTSLILSYSVPITDLKETHLKPLFLCSLWSLPPSSSPLLLKMKLFIFSKFIAVNIYHTSSRPCSALFISSVASVIEQLLLAPLQISISDVDRYFFSFLWQSPLQCNPSRDTAHE